MALIWREFQGNIGLWEPQELGEKDEDERRAFISTHDLLTSESGPLLFHCISMESIQTKLGFLGGSVVKSPPASAGDMGLIPGLGRSHMRRSN